MRDTMTDFIHTVRGAEALSEPEALDALEVLVPVLLVAPEDLEAVDAARRTIARMPPDSALSAVMDWWLVATAGSASPLGLAFRLPESIPHALREAMEAVAQLSHERLRVPPARWIRASCDHDRLLGELDHYLLLDSYGKSRLSGERDVWAYLQRELHPVVTALHEGRPTEPFELDERTYEKEMRKSGIEANSRRWNEMVKRADECVGRVNEVVALHRVVEPWIARERPPLLEAIPGDSDAVGRLGPLADLVFTSITGADSRADRPVPAKEVAARLRGIAAGLDDAGLSWLASVVDTWMERTGLDVEPLVAALRRRDAVGERIQRLRSAAVDVDDAELLLLDHDVAGAERLLDRIEERRRQERREEALRRAVERHRAPETLDHAPEGWDERVGEAERLLDAGDAQAAERIVQGLDAELKAFRRRDALAELRAHRDRLARLRAPASVLSELDAYAGEMERTEKLVDASILQRWRERVGSLADERRRDAERRVQTARELLDTEQDLIPRDSLPDLELALVEVERALADGEVMGALDQATRLVETIEGQRVHRWRVGEGEQKLVEHVIDYCTQQLHFDPDDVRRLYVAAKTKPFVILAGLTGSGKSTIARLFAAALGAHAANGRFRRIAVRPDWIDQSEVLGSVNPLRNRFEPGWLAETARQCERNPDQLHVVLLDEMNLAPVEQYLAEYLSALEESRSGAERTDIPLYSRGAAPENGDEWPPVLPFPPNLIVMGTVNVDETTRVMSERVLDRANVLQLSVAVSDAHHRPRTRSVQPWYVPFPEWDGVCVREPDARNHRFLVEVGEILQTIGIGVGQRAHTELERFVANASGILEPGRSLDLGVLQRIIPKVRGFKRDLDSGLAELHEKLTGAGCTRSAAVLARWLDESVPDDDYLDGTDARIGLLR